MKTIRTEKVTEVKVWRVNNGSVCGVMCPWMVSVNGKTLGEILVARYQPDPMVFKTRAIAREFANRLVMVDLIEEYPNGRVYAVPTTV